MRILAWILATLFLVLSVNPVSAEERKPAQAHQCKVRNGYVMAVGTGSSKSLAREAARERCGNMMIDHQFAQRSKVDADTADDLILSCVNLECI